MIVLFLAGAVAGRSQGVRRLGGEFSLVGLIPNDQVLPALSLTATGGALAFYNQGLGIYGSVLGAEYTGATISSVNKTATGDQVRPGVAELRNGNTIFVWQSSVPGSPDIFARLGKGTNFYTADLRLNNYITDQQVDPAVAALPDGGAMVVWASYGQDGSLWGVYARKVMANGTLAGAQEFLVNQYTIGNQRKPAVCALAGGNVVFAWVSEGERFLLQPGHLRAGLYRRRGSGDAGVSGQFGHQYVRRAGAGPVEQRRIYGGLEPEGRDCGQ